MFFIDEFLEIFQKGLRILGIIIMIQQVGLIKLDRMIIGIIFCSVIVIKVGYFSVHINSSILMYHKCKGQTPSFKNILAYINTHLMVWIFIHKADEINNIELKAWMVK